MQKASQIRPYPWNRLETVSRDAVALLRETRRAVKRAVDEGKISRVLSELVGEQVTVLVTHVAVATELPASQGTALALATSDDSVQVALDVDRELARTLVARIVQRPVRLGDPRAAHSAEIDGALLALVSSAARRAHGAEEALRPVGPGTLRLASGERCLEIRTTLILGSEAYGVRAAIQFRKPFVMDPGPPSQRLAALGALPISMPVVAALSSATGSEIASLSAGDVWMPGPGWSLHRANSAPPSSSPPPRVPLKLTGEVTLTAPGAERGIRGRLGEEGEIVVLGLADVPLDAENPMSSKADHETLTSEVVLDAPLVVRVEVGAVTMPASEWAALGPGDVIAMGRRVAEPVVLRVAGLEVARGELVDVEGELGVRIRELVKPTR